MPARSVRPLRSRRGCRSMAALPWSRRITRSTRPWRSAAGWPNERRTRATRNCVDGGRIPHRPRGSFPPPWSCTGAGLIPGAIVGRLAPYYFARPARQGPAVRHLACREKARLAGSRCRRLADGCRRAARRRVSRARVGFETGAGLKLADQAARRLRYQPEKFAKTPYGNLPRRLVTLVGRRLFVPANPSEGSFAGRDGLFPRTPKAPWNGQVPGCGARARSPAATTNPGRRAAAGACAPRGTGEVARGGTAGGTLRIQIRIRRAGCNAAAVAPP